MTEHENYPTAVENLQRYLRQLSFEEGEDIFTPPLDGVFEADTERSLRDFQRSRGIAETGSADRQTWELLYAAYRASLAGKTPPRSLDIFPRFPSGYRMRVGTRSFAVLVLQYMLGELHAIYGEMADVAQTGVYDEATARAVREFQRANRIPQTGEVDLLTWNLLADQYNLLFTQENVE